MGGPACYARPVSGTLYVVATPIGNLEDLSPRAGRILREVSLIACEDTRRTSRLLARHGIENHTISCHKFNERERLTPVLEVLGAGHDVALVSDGGTPGVSDPGALLVGAAHDMGVRVCPIPGPSAVSTILSISGLEGARYVFDGFLPHRAGERRRRLRELREEGRTIVVLETPHRIREALRDIAGVLGRDRRIVLGRELTKRHETVLRGTADDVEKALGGDTARGEITLVIKGASASARETTDDREMARVLKQWDLALREAAGDRREALRQCAKALGVRKDELSRRLDELGR